MALLGLFSAALFIVLVTTDIRNTLDEERRIFQSRIAAANLYIQDAVTPVGMLHSQLTSALEAANPDGSGLLFAGGVEVPPAILHSGFGVYEICLPDGKWSVIGTWIASENVAAAEKELAVAMGLIPMMESLVESRMESSWIYYFSAMEFMLVAPPFEALHEDAFQGLYNYPFWVEVQPLSNPGRSLIVTDVYEDAGGLGQMITFSRPVYRDGRFLGALCIDLTLEQLREALSLGRSYGRTLIADDNRHPVVGQYGPPAGDVTDSTFNFMGATGRFVRFGKWMHISNLLLEDELWIVHSVDMLHIMLLSIRDTLPILVILAGLNILLALMFRLKASYDSAQRESAFSRRILKIIGHDLKNSLTYTSQAIELHMRSGEPEGLEIARRSTGAAITLLNDLSYWGDVRFRAVAIRSHPFPASYAVSRAVDTVQAAAELKGIVLESTITDGVLNADLDVLTTVLRNLLNNAIKFSMPGDAVSIVLKREDPGFFRLQVIDRGRGMSDEQVAKILKREPLSSETGTRGEKGSGIGLGLVTEFCDQAGWRIEVESAPKTGTVFSLLVPAGTGPIP